MNLGLYNTFIAQAQIYDLLKWCKGFANSFLTYNLKYTNSKYINMTDL